jgi:hypothetical protein
MQGGLHFHLTKESEAGMAIPASTWQPPLVEFHTSMGDFAVELYWQHAPNTCRNFAELVRAGGGGGGGGGGATEALVSEL